MLTAAHCSDFFDGSWIYNGAEQKMGTTDFIQEIFGQWPYYDSGVIRLDPGKSNAAWIYGNWSGSLAFPVIGFARGIPAGGGYCISGAFSTPNCNIRSGDQVCLKADWIPFGRCIYYIEIHSATGNTIFCGGDSGGPIYYWVGNGIYAAGIQGFGYKYSQIGNCYRDGGVSVVSSAMDKIPGLWVLTR
jgi:hypothetical protein